MPAVAAAFVRASGGGGVVAVPVVEVMEVAVVELAEVVVVVVVLVAVVVSVLVAVAEVNEAVVV
jgi:hypothetical protein